MLRGVASGVRGAQEIPGVSPLPEGYNPATWMLEVSGGGAKMHTAAVKADFAALYRTSLVCHETEQRAAEVAAIAKARSKPLALASRYAASRARQTIMVTWKLFLVYWCASRSHLSTRLQVTSAPKPSAPAQRPRDARLSGCAWPGSPPHEQARSHATAVSERSRPAHV